eukprot:GHUV01005739.1.p1 GENE.GHUV01005739.1~~GHUV01005739.1.p1  ORF type:complete len:160 (+),score=44.89 GHUV01005739.1:371-850(+)
MGVAASHIDGTGNQLIKAAKAGQVDLVTELLSAHPGLLRYHTLRHLNICHFAARADHVDVLEQLFSKAEEVEFLGRLHGGNRLEPNIVQQLANASSDRGVTPLMLAVERGCVESVKLLLSKVRGCTSQQHLQQQACYCSCRTAAVDVSGQQLTTHGKKT